MIMKKIKLIGLGVIFISLLISCSCRNMEANSKHRSAAAKHADSLTLQATCGKCGKSSCDKSCAPY